MGTTYSVAVTQLPAGVARASVQSAIDDVLAQINSHLSTYDDSSEISTFNAARHTEFVAVSATLGEVVAIADEVSDATGGAFDITVGPLVRAWGFAGPDARPAATPDLPALDRIRVVVGQDKLEAASDEQALRKRVPEIELDVSGVAPGYAVDRIAGRLDALGLHDYLIELGGEVRARGRSPAGRPWRVAVEAPLAGERRPFALVELAGLSASTSGDYREFRIVEGQRISHTIDPRTGRPVVNALASVCVVHPSAAYADAYATALMVLGPGEGMSLAKARGLAALFILRTQVAGSFEARSTPEFDRLRRPLN
jgi:thiamine biosynthesis lipoprotein